jgi:hypothetical protein
MGRAVPLGRRPGNAWRRLPPVARLPSVLGPKGHWSRLRLIQYTTAAFIPAHTSSVVPFHMLFPAACLQVSLRIYLSGPTLVVPLPFLGQAFKWIVWATCLRWHSCCCWLQRQSRSVIWWFANLCLYLRWAGIFRSAFFSPARCCGDGYRPIHTSARKNCETATVFKPSSPLLKACNFLYGMVLQSTQR